MGPYANISLGRPQKSGRAPLLKSGRYDEKKKNQTLKIWTAARGARPGGEGGEQPHCSPTETQSDPTAAPLRPKVASEINK